jgi:hypothetical protein
MIHEGEDDQLHNANEAFPSGRIGTAVLLDEQSNYVIAQRFYSPGSQFVLQLNVVELKLHLLTSVIFRCECVSSVKMRAGEVCWIFEPHRMTAMT